MKIGFLSDLHGSDIKKFNFNDVDLILSNGDFARSDLIRKYWLKYKLKHRKNWRKELSKEKVKEAEDEIRVSGKKFLNFFKKRPVYFVYGNVEKGKYFKFKLKNNVHNINQKVVNIKGIKIAGVEYVRERWWIDKFVSGGYENNEGEIKRFLDKLEKVDILLTHTPPFGYLDLNDNPNTPKMRGYHHGSKLVLDYIKRKQPKYCLCGHIHEAKGKVKIGKTIVINGGLSGFEKIEITK